MECKADDGDPNKQSVRVEHVIPNEDELKLSPQQSYECDVCGQKVKTKANLRAHRIKTHRIVETESDIAFLYRTKRDVKRLFHCPVSGCKYQDPMRGFPKYSALRQHYTWVHGSREHMCSTCLRLFPTATLMERHRLSCGQLHVCLKCGRRYSELKYLRQHIKRTKHMEAGVGPGPALQPEPAAHMDGAVSIAPTPSTSGGQPPAFAPLAAAGPAVQALQPIIVPVVVPYPVAAGPLKGAPVALDSSVIAEAVAAALRPIIERMSAETGTQTSPQLPPGPGPGPAMVHVAIAPLSPKREAGLDGKKLGGGAASEAFIGLPADMSPLLQPVGSQTEDLFGAAYDRPCLHVETQTCAPADDLLAGGPLRNLQTPQPQAMAPATAAAAAAELLSNMETQTDPIDAWIEAELSDIETQTSAYDLDSLLVETCSQTQASI